MIVYITQASAARLLGMTHQGVACAVARGSLVPDAKTDLGTPLFRMAEVARYAEENRNQAAKRCKGRVSRHASWEEPCVEY